MASKDLLTRNFGGAEQHSRPFWILILGSVTVVLTISAVFIYFSTQTIERGVSSRHLETARRAESTIKQALKVLLAEKRRLSREVAPKEKNSEQILAVFIKDNPEFERISLANAAGEEILRLDKFSVIKKEDLTDWTGSVGFERSGKGEQYIGSVFFSERGEPIVPVFTPIFSLRGEFLGALVADLNLKFMWNLVADIKVGAAGRVYVVDSRGNLIADPDASLVLKGENLFFRPVVRKLAEGQELVGGLAAGERYKDFSGRKVFAAGILIKDLGWGVITEEPVKDALLASRRTLAAGAGLASATTLLLLFLSFTINRLSRAMRSLEQERAHNYSIINNLTDGIVEYANDLRILLLNPEAERLLDVNSSDIAGKSPAELKRYFPQKIGPLLKIFGVIPSAGKIKSKYGDGRTRVEELTLEEPAEKTLEITTVPILTPGGKLLSNIKILRDITREKIIERLKSEFISIAAHQLRTPLSAIKWALRLILDGDFGALNSQQREYLQSGYDTNERMIKLVNDLLDVSRIEEGRFELILQEEDLASLVETTVASFKDIAAQKNVKLLFIVPKKPLPAIPVDRQKIEMVFQNLIENALAYTPGGGTVRVAIEENDDSLTVSVRDTGIGVPREEQGRLFTKFYRSAGALKIQPGGSGLGLFISRNIVIGHRGSLEVKSEVDKGSMFTVRLPKKRVSLANLKEAEFGEFIKRI